MTLDSLGGTELTYRQNPHVHQNPSAPKRRRLAGKKQGESGPGPSRRVRHGDIFTAGSIVRESGVYEVLHQGHHRDTHEVVMIAKDLFPPCEVCDAKVRYRVIRTAPYIFSDEDFQEPSN